MQFSDAHSRVTNGSVGLDPIRAWKKTDLVRMMTAIDCGRKIERQNNNFAFGGAWIAVDSVDKQATKLAASGQDGKLSRSMSKRAVDSTTSHHFERNPLITRK